MKVNLSDTGYVFCPVLKCAILPKFCTKICKYYEGIHYDDAQESGGIMCGHNPCQECRYKKGDDQK